MSMDPNDPKYSDTPNVDTHPLEGRGPGEPAGAAVIRNLAALRREATPGPWIRPWEANHLHGIGGDFDVTERQEDLDFCAAAGSFSADQLDALADLVDAATAATKYGEPLRSPRNSLGKLALPKGLMERAVEAAWEGSVSPVGDPADGIEQHNLADLADGICDWLADRNIDGSDEVRRLLGYLWTATGKNHLRPVSDLFAPDDPIVADIERLAIFPEEATR